MDKLAEAIRLYLLSKGVETTFDWREMLEQEHDFNFTVAKMNQVELLTETQLLVAQAIGEGMSYERFAKALKPRLIERGWWGVQVMQDPWSEEEQLVQLGSERRMKVIYETNMRTAYAYGQYQRSERVKDTLPYFVYELGPSSVHRPEHVSWAGTMLPVDHSFWSTHYPPNGWGCKCRLRQISQFEFDKLKINGLSARVTELDSEGVPTGRFTQETIAVRTDAPAVKMQPYINKRTGEYSMVPQGIDPGWAYHPKYRRQVLERELEQKEAAYQAAVQGLTQ